MRQDTLNALKQDQLFDLLVVGGGATGCGISLDAAARGLKVALVEKEDIAAGTSSRSTKLVHGGVRYLEKAVKGLDRAHYELVKEGLRERGIFLENATHLARRMAFVIPLYRWSEVPLMLAGLKLYDFLAGKKSIGKSRLLSRQETLKRMPLVKAEGLKAGILYYDGQFDDARMTVSLALSAERHGAIIANYVEVTSLCKDDGRVCGATVRDRLSGDEWTVRAKGVVNATGPYTDVLRRMENPDVEPILTVSSGAHIALDKSFSVPDAGLLIPMTEDGRILFVLPWQGHTLIGTTDDPATLSEHPPVSAEEINYLLRHVSKTLQTCPTREDIQATWSGLRPLVGDAKNADTSSLVRDYVISMGRGDLLTIAGGKWTSYRRMAEDAVDHAIAVWSLTPSSPCSTTSLPVIGSENYRERRAEELQEKYGLAEDVARRLNQAYGDQAERVIELGKEGLLSRLHEEHPFIEAEVLYAVRYEFAVQAIDVVARRLPLAMVDTNTAIQVLPRVVSIMADELGWDREQRQLQIKVAMERLKKAL